MINGDDLDVQVDVLGKEYYVMTYVEEAEIGIVATEDSTNVTVTLPNSQHGNLQVSYYGVTYYNNDSFSFTLNRQVSLAVLTLTMTIIITLLLLLLLLLLLFLLFIFFF